MKKLSLLLLLAVLVNSIFAQGQTDSRNGRKMPAKGIFRIFFVFAEVTGDPYNKPMAGWTEGQMPNNSADYIDLHVSVNYQSYMSRYFNEISFGELKVLGDYHPQLIQIPYNSFANESQSVDRVFEKLATLCNGQQIQTARGFNFPEDFDLWDLSTEEGQVKQNIKDGAIDCIIIVWRVNSRLATTQGSGAFNYDKTFNIGNKVEISNYGRVYPSGSGDFFIIRHEFAHLLLGGNNFHSGGAGAGIGTYMQNYSGYSLLSSWNRYMPGYNAWDRYRLGWKNSQHVYDISARNENGQEVNADLDYTLQVGDSIIYVLRDFASTGNAVRVKLPYIRTLNPSAKEQWIWIENHQLLPDKMEYEESLHGANSQMFRVPRGIYLNLQTGNDDFSSFSSSTNYIAPVNRFGRFDFTAYTTSPSVMGETNDAHANPFTGVGLASYHPNDVNGNGTIPGGEMYSLAKIKYNGVELGTEYFGYYQYPYLGSVFDAYYQGDKISISTNPAPFTWLTYERNSNGAIYNPTPQSTDNRKIYLNGLSIRVVEQQINGDVKICIRWKDYDVKNDIRWCGDVILNEKVNLLSGNTILLDQGLTPVRPNYPITFNGKQIFADPTLFTCKQGSLFKANSESTIHLKNNSTLVAENGSEVELDGANLIVESGATLHIKSGATLRIKNGGNVDVKSGGYLCIEQGAIVILQDYNSVIKMRQDATNSCSAITYSGNGSIIDYSQDVYIQNETITTNRYIGGKNIYVGSNVTNTKPQGNVVITGGAHVIFDAAGKVIFDTGFKCALGSSFEIRK